MKHLLCILLVMLVANIPAKAYYTCTGPVTGLSLSNGGVVTISGFNGIVDGYLCQIGASANNVSSDTCKAMYARLLIAEATGKSLTLYFNDSLTCSTQPNWGWLSGFYFGPGTI